MSSWPSVHVEHWLKALSQKGHEVHFIPYSQDSEVDGFPEGVFGHRFSWNSTLRGSRPIIRALELRYRLKEIAPDIFHVHSIFAAQNGRHFFWILAMCSFHPLVLTAWGSDLLRIPEASRMGRFLVKLVLRAADLVTADSQSLLDAAHRMGVSRRRLNEIQFGVDTKLFNSGIETDEIRRLLDLGSGPVVFSPRAFKPIYNQMRIVEAVPIVLQRYPDCRFIFKCRPDHHSARYEEDVRKRIEELGVKHAVRIVPPIPYEQLPALYAISDVIVSVPESDGTPRSLLEAMACGSFPVVSDVPALHEWIDHGANGMIVQSTEGQEIGKAILKALSSEGILRIAKVKNRKIVECRASQEFWVAQLETLYSRILR